MKVTVVVPTRNSGRTIAACLDSLHRQTHPCTIVVVDNFSSDDTFDLAHARADLVYIAGPERSAQRNIGAHLCPADIVGFIDSDMVLSDNVVREAVEEIARGSGGVIVPERTVGVGFWSRVRAFERSFYHGFDAIESARFFQWAVFEATGGFDEGLTGPEDIDITLRARRLSTITRTVAGIDHDEGHVGYLDACRRKGYYADGLRRYTEKYGWRSVPSWMNRPWLRQPRRLLSIEGLGLLALKSGEAVAVVNALVRARLREDP